MFSLKSHLKLTIISSDTTDLNKLFIFCLSRSVKSTNCLPSNTTNTNTEYQNEFIEKWSDLRSDHFENVKSSSPNHTVYESLETFGKTDESSISKIQKDCSSELSAVRVPNFKLQREGKVEISLASLNKQLMANQLTYLADKDASLHRPLHISSKTNSHFCYEYEL